MSSNPSLSIRRRRSKEEGRSGNDNQNNQLNRLDVDATGQTPAPTRPPNDGVSSEPADKGAAAAFRRRMKARQEAQRARRRGN